MKLGQDAWLMLSLARLWGCGSAEDVHDVATPPADNASGEAAQESPAAMAEESAGESTAESAELRSATSSGGREPGQSATTTTVAKEIIPGAIARKPAAGPLAASAKPLSMTTPDHFALLKLDLERVRNAPLIKDATRRSRPFGE